MNQSIGIIGGGQLGMLLCQAAQELGLSSCVLCDNPAAPAMAYADTVLLAAEDDPDAVRQLIQNCSVITFEKEAIADTTLLNLAAAEKREEVAVRPGVGVIRLLKDKGLQKQWLSQQGFPVLPFRVIDGRGSIVENPEFFNQSWVQKARQGGYDGKAVQILHTAPKIEDYWDTPSVLEHYLPDCREIAVLTARNPRGDASTFPVVDMQFDSQLNALNVASAPSRLPEAIVDQATLLAEAVIDKLDGVGIFAVEMFVDSNGNLYVNEISPRVHNAGHLTLELCATSQFAQHLRAVLDMPLGATTSRGSAAMVNLLYREGLESAFGTGPQRRKRPKTQSMVYWYGKTPGTPGRKMGHITSLAHGVDQAIANVFNALKDSTTAGDRFRDRAA